MEQLIVGVDIGGTNTVVGVYNEELQLLDKGSFRTGCDPSQGLTAYPEPYFDRLTAYIKELLARQSVAAYGIRAGFGVPGRVDSARGVVLRSSNLGWSGVPFAEEMERRLGAPVTIDNDVRMYALGEAIAGAARGCRNALCVTLGTGMAAGVILEGRLIRGSHWYAGEIGHDPVAGNNAQCNCGRIGCLETIASATGIARLAEEAVHQSPDNGILSVMRQSGPLTSKDVYKACLSGDTQAIGIFRFVGRTLGRKLLTALLLGDFEAVVIGGGAAAAGDYLLDPIREIIEGHYNRGFGPEVRQCMLADEAGMLGAAHSVRTAVI